MKSSLLSKFTKLTLLVALATGGFSSFANSAEASLVRLNPFLKQTASVNTNGTPVNYSAVNVYDTVPPVNEQRFLTLDPVNGNQISVTNSNIVGKTIRLQNELGFYGGFTQGCLNLTQNVVNQPVVYFTCVNNDSGQKFEVQASGFGDIQGKKLVYLKLSGYNLYLNAPSTSNNAQLNMSSTKNNYSLWLLNVDVP
jgi:hypothetical protein